MSVDRKHQPLRIGIPKEPEWPEYGFDDSHVNVEGQQIEKNDPRQTAQRRRGRVGFVDGQVIVGGKTWQVELVRRGIRPERTKLPDKEKHRNPAIRKRPEMQLDERRKRGDWRGIVADRNRRREVIESRKEGAQDLAPDEDLKVSQQPGQRDVNIRPSYRPVEVVPATPFPKAEGFISKVPGELVRAPRYPRTLGERAARRLGL